VTTIEQLWKLETENCLQEHATYSKLVLDLCRPTTPAKPKSSRCQGCGASGCEKRCLYCGSYR